MIVAVRVLGAALVLAGVTLAINPEMVGPLPPTETLFDAVEQRAKWGWPIVVGIALLMYVHYRPWSLVAATLCVAIPLGYLVSRLIGIIMLGADSKQWLWLAIEVVLVIGFFVWYQKLKKRHTSRTKTD